MSPAPACVPLNGFWLDDGVRLSPAAVAATPACRDGCVTAPAAPPMLRRHLHSGPMASATATRGAATACGTSFCAARCAPPWAPARRAAGPCPWRTGTLSSGRWRCWGARCSSRWWRAAPARWGCSAGADAAQGCPRHAARRLRDSGRAVHSQPLAGLHSQRCALSFAADQLARTLMALFKLPCRHRPPLPAVCGHALPEARRHRLGLLRQRCGGGAGGGGGHGLEERPAAAQLGGAGAGRARGAARGPPPPARLAHLLAPRWPKRPLRLSGRVSALPCASSKAHAPG